MDSREPDQDLNDDVLSEEIELLGNLVLAASGVTRRLTQEEVDGVLQLDSPRAARPRTSHCEC